MTSRRPPVTWLEWAGVVLVTLLAVDLVTLFVSYGMLPGEGEPNPPSWNAVFIVTGIGLPVLFAAAFAVVVASLVRARRRR